VLSVKAKSAKKGTPLRVRILDAASQDLQRVPGVPSAVHCHPGGRALPGRRERVRLLRERGISGARIVAGAPGADTTGTGSNPVGDGGKTFVFDLP
jgi:hypothetical protein